MELLFFLDTANVAEIKEAISLGVIHGVTTNPTLVARENTGFEALVREICALLPGFPVSVEVMSTAAAGMVEEARRLKDLAPNIVIKIPMGLEGLKAVSRLEGSTPPVPCNMTLVFSANQALLAARAGASYISPFIGRIDDTGWDGVRLVEEMAVIFEAQRLEARIIAASIRHPLHVTGVAAAGAHIATVPMSVLMQMTRHPLTDLGIERFLADWGGVT